MTVAAIAGQAKTGAASGVGSTTATPPGAVTLGDCMLLFVQTNAGITVSSVTDTLGNKWNSLVTQTNGGQLSCWIVNAALAGTPTITINLSGTGSCRWAFTEYSGTADVRANVKSVATATGTVTAGLTVAPSVQWNNSGELNVLAVGDSTSGTTWTDTTATMTARISGTTTLDLAVFDRINSTISTGAANETMTASQSVTGQAVVVTLNADDQPYLVSRTSNSSASATSLAASITPLQGTLLVVAAYTNGSGQTTSGITDNQSNTWTKLATNTLSGGGELSLWYAWALAVASTTVTVNFSGAAAPCGFALARYDGYIPPSTMLDATGTNNGSGTAVSVSASGAIAFSDEIVLTCFVHNNTSVLTPTAPSGTASEITVSGGSARIALVHQKVTAGGTPSVAGTLGSTGTWSAVMACLKIGAPRANQAIGTNQTGSSVAQTVTNGVSVGQLMVVAVTAPTTTVTGVTDSLGNTYTKAVAQVNGSLEDSLWYAPVTTGGLATVTVNLNASNSIAWAVYTYSGIDTTYLGVSTASATGNSQTASVTSAALETTPELVIAIAGSTGTLTFTPTLPFVNGLAIRTNPNLTVAHTQGVSPNTATASFAISGGANVNWSAAIAAFRATRSVAAFTRSPSDTITTLTDSLSRATAFLRTVAADTITTLTDSLTRTTAWTRSLTDTLTTLTDSLSRTAVWTHSISDTLATLTDSPSATASYVRTVTDTLSTLVDSLSTAIAWVRSISDTLATLTDSPSRSVSWARTVTDTLATLTESVGTRLAFARTLGADTLMTLTDVLSRRVSWTRLVTTTIATLTDVLADVLHHPSRAVYADVDLSAALVTACTMQAGLITVVPLTGSPTVTVVLRAEEAE